MKKLFALLFGGLVLVGMTGAGGVLYGFWKYGRDLPDYTALKDYEPPVATRIHAGDGRLLAEFAVQRRVFVPIEAMPRRVVNAFLAAEDKDFYNHFGVSLPSILRAALTNLRNLGSNRRPVGASTITQQVAKNFLLTNELSIERKAKEAILAVRMERALSKSRILELYLNEIYLGFGSYGVAAAALNYFNKSLDELDLGEAAYLAALPKAPNNYHPVRARREATARRNWVLSRMAEDGHISAEQAEAAQLVPLEVRPPQPPDSYAASYFVEEVRRELADRQGEKALYEGGLSVRTTLDTRLQGIAQQVLRAGLVAYDRRHYWRGPLERLEPGAAWEPRLSELAKQMPPPDGWRLAMVRAVDDDGADLLLRGGGEGRIPLSELRWARLLGDDGKAGPRVRKAGDVLQPGDVIYAEPVTETGSGKDKTPLPEGSFTLRQIPGVNGGLVAMDPHTGRILAMSGGFSFERSQFNRATQAMRQPGSAFKPFVYLAALDSGMTPSTRILDAPFVIDQGAGLGKWKPANYTREFYGPSPMRLGIEKSRNLMTVRLAQTIGMEKIAAYAQRFGIVDSMPRQLSMSLGAGETTLLKLTAAYGMLVNGGREITPTLIDRIQDRTGRTIWKHEARGCPGCEAAAWRQQPVPVLPDTRKALTSPASAYQIVAMLQGAVQRGTGVRVRAVGKPLAGKTGTTNESRDTWFVGFAPDLAVGVFAGFDEPKPLGRRETGSSVAAPIFRDFMAAALEKQPGIPFRIPPGVQMVRVEPQSGRLARPGDKAILEAFKAGVTPGDNSTVLDGGYVPADYRKNAGTGGLY